MDMPEYRGFSPDYRAIFWDETQNGFQIIPIHKLKLEAIHFQHPVKQEEQDFMEEYK